MAEVVISSSDDQGDGEALFLKLLPQFKPMLELLVRRSGLSQADAEDFVSTAHTRLIEDDYAIVRACVARNEPKAYLAVTLAHFLCDFRNAKWGRWRPSAAARRLGPIAIRLETLMERDGVSMLESVRMLCSTDPALREPDVLSIAKQLPRRIQAREVDLDHVSLDEERDAEEAPADLDALGPKVQAALAAVLPELPAEDLLVTRMRFCDGLSIADISRILKLEQKPLYRRVLHIEATLRRRLTEHGVSAAEVRDAVANHFMSSLDWCGQ